MTDEVKFDDPNRPQLTIARVLEEHHRSSISQIICYCGFLETRFPSFSPYTDGLDLHRAEVLWNTFRIEDA
jgi:hypothetical protein